MVTHTEPETDKLFFEKLISIKWGDGYRCPRCGGLKYWLKAERRIMICKGCRREISPMADTMFSRSHLSLKQWSDIVKLVTSSPDRVVTASFVAREIGIGSYRTAWEALRKIRFAISTNEPRKKLDGNVEFDELVISGQGSDYSKLSILGALEVAGEKRLSLQMIKNPDEMNIKDYLRKRFSRNTTIIIDPEKLYIRNWLELNRIKQTSAKRIYGSNFMNLHVILEDIKYGLRNGHHGVSEKFLQENLDEYVFIFNHNDDREKACEILLEYMVNTSIRKYRLAGKKNRTFLSILWGNN
ncbi:MAG: IS1595 family transposase [Spirochaetales bacterium]|nr:IS1595 family transposase [Spirochaetales bacterium]